MPPKKINKTVLKGPFAGAKASAEAKSENSLPGKAWQAAKNYMDAGKERKGEWLQKNAERNFDTEDGRPSPGQVLSQVGNVLRSGASTVMHELDGTPNVSDQTTNADAPVGNRKASTKPEAYGRKNK